MPDATLWAIQWHRKWGRANWIKAQAFREIGWLDHARYHQNISAHHYQAALERLVEGA